MELTQELEPSRASHRTERGLGLNGLGLQGFTGFRALGLYPMFAQQLGLLVRRFSSSFTYLCPAATALQQQLLLQRQLFLSLFDDDTDDDYYYDDPIVIYAEEDGRSICP